MGQEPRTGGTQVSAEGTRDPQEIRRDIEETRDELGDTVEALAEKTDVKSQTQKKIADVKQSVNIKKDEVIGRARQASPEGARSAAGTMSQKARENPLPVAVAGAFVAGLLFGRITNR
jgi:ElaB/YqjD/DUF883 family membrane-anchored ribosome-binding protein